jgi:uncharacterized protein
VSTRSRTALDEAEIQALLARNCWGVLAMSINDTPYAVPIIYGYDGEQFVFANGPGQKLETLKANPVVCLVIAEVENAGKVWRSVVAKGRVDWITDEAQRLVAFELIRQQMGFTAERAEDAEKIATAPLARIIPTEITGRTAGN